MVKPPVKTAQRKPEPKKELPARVSANDSQLPAHMRGDVGEGRENLGRDDLEIPRLKLIQGISPEVDQFGLRPGCFYHTASEDVFDKPFLAVPVYIDKQYILWRPREDGGGILARASDGVHWNPANVEFEVKLDKKDGGARVTWRTANTVTQSGLAQWGSMDPNNPQSPPAATLMYSYVLAFPEHPDLMTAVLSFQRSSIKIGRRLNSNVATKRAPCYGLQYQFSAVKDKNSAGQEFYNVGFTGMGFVEDPEMYERFKAMHRGFKTAGLNIRDLEGAQEDPETGGDGDDTGEDSGAAEGRPRY